MKEINIPIIVHGERGVIKALFQPEQPAAQEPNPWPETATSIQPGPPQYGDPVNRNPNQEATATDHHSVQALTGERLTEVGAQLGYLENCQTEIAAKLSQLRDRLRPVLRPVPVAPAGGTPGNIPEPLLCPLAKTLHDQVQVNHHFVNALDELLALIELPE